jgi:hypothetical protein
MPECDAWRQPIHFRHTYIHEDDIEMVSAAAATGSAPPSTQTTQWPAAQEGLGDVGSW